MQWYKFILPQNELQSDKQDEIVNRLKGLVDTLNDRNAKHTLLLFRTPPDYKYVIYYLTSPNNDILQIFVESNNAIQCPNPELNECEEGSTMKFLVGDLGFWKSTLEPKSTNKSR